MPRTPLAAWAFCPRAGRGACLLYHENPFTSKVNETPANRQQLFSEEPLLEPTMSDTKTSPTLEVGHTLPTCHKNNRGEASHSDLQAQLRCATLLVHKSEALTALRYKLVQAPSEVRHHIHNGDGIYLEMPTEAKPKKDVVTTMKMNFAI